jgi:hypothetical protein
VERNLRQKPKSLDLVDLHMNPDSLIGPNTNWAGRHKEEHSRNIRSHKTQKTLTQSHRQRYRVHAMITVLHSAAQTIELESHVVANETWQAGYLDSWTPGVWAGLCWHCGQDLVPARLPIRDPIYCQVASHSADQLVRNAFFMPAGGRRTTEKLTATSWVFILWSDLFPSLHPFSFPLIPLSRSDKININQQS